MLQETDGGEVHQGAGETSQLEVAAGKARLLDRAGTYSQVPAA